MKGLIVFGPPGGLGKLGKMGKINKKTPWVKWVVYKQILCQTPKNARKDSLNFFI